MYSRKREGDAEEQKEVVQYMVYSRNSKEEAQHGMYSRKPREEPCVRSKSKEENQNEEEPEEEAVINPDEMKTLLHKDQVKMFRQQRRPTCLVSRPREEAPNEEQSKEEDQDEEEAKEEDQNGRRPEPMIVWVRRTTEPSRPTFILFVPVLEQPARSLCLSPLYTSRSIHVHKAGPVVFIPLGPVEHVEADSIVI